MYFLITLVFRECLPLQNTNWMNLSLTGQFHYLVDDCSLFSLFALQMDKGGLWDYRCLVAF